MKTDDYLTRIKNYIFNQKFTRALLIDGDWGCGKSYFVKNKLISEIDKTLVQADDEEGNGSEDKSGKKEEYYKSLLISLYGLSSIETP